MGLRQKIFRGRIVDVSSRLVKHPHKSPTYQLGQKRVVIHNSDRPQNLDVLELSREFVSPNSICRTGCDQIIWHDAIDLEGAIFHCASYDHQLMHTRGWNRQSISVGLLYRSTNLSGLSERDYAPTKEQYQALIGHLGVLCLYAHISPDNIYGHRELSPPLFTFQKGHRDHPGCPGLRLDLDKIRADVISNIQSRLKLEGKHEDAPDGILTDRLEEEILCFSSTKASGKEKD